MGSDSRVWAITTYFNPNRYSSRRENYDTFKRYLSLPLCTVEHSTTGVYELKAQDAELLIQVTSRDVLWQKERLLNIARKYLPKEAEIVVWVDCDLVFATPGWHQGLSQLLDVYAVVQCFSNLEDLPDTVGSIEGQMTAPPVTRRSFAAVVNESVDLPGHRAQRFIGLQRSCPGGAWAARRAFLERHSFYDSMILGGGDRAFACACSGDIEEAIRIGCLQDSRAEDYKRWAGNVLDDTRGRIGLIEGNLLHLWHGTLEDRIYFGRHEELRRLNFCPSRDLVTDSSGAWRWSALVSEELRMSVRLYFASRREDGTRHDEFGVYPR